jgi:hypothetical protein
MVEITWTSGRSSPPKLAIVASSIALGRTLRDDLGLECRKIRLVAQNPVGVIKFGPPTWIASSLRSSQ